MFRRRSRPDPPPRTTTLVGSGGSVSITAHPDPGRVRRRREPRHLPFVADHWLSLAAAAHAGYREHGAGAVVVLASSPAAQSWLDHLDAAFRGPRRTGKLETQSIWYTTQVHTLPGAGEAWFDGWEARQIEHYDPRREAVIVLLGEDGTGDPSGYRVAGTPAPADAYRQARVGLN
jgi:hypothetical protein